MGRIKFPEIVKPRECLWADITPRPMASGAPPPLPPHSMPPLANFVDERRSSARTSATSSSENLLSEGTSARDASTVAGFRLARVTTWRLFSCQSACDQQGFCISGLTSKACSFNSVISPSRLSLEKANPRKPVKSSSIAAGSRVCTAPIVADAYVSDLENALHRRIIRID